MLPARHLIFTDLDGTLLDPQTYTWSPAQEALEEIERLGVPLILVTSKTRAEVELLRRKLGHGHPFITENGGGIFIPQGYFNLRLEGATRAGRYQCIALARPYGEVTAALDEIAEEAGASVVGFHQMRVREIAQNTGLSLKQAELAKQREFDEPFFFAGNGEAATQAFERLARHRGFELAHGGRFWHLFAGSDKGRAVRQLIKLYRQAEHKRFRAIGLGDSENDLPLLAAVDHPILIPTPDGKYSREIESRLPHLVKAPLPGPAGWNAAVKQVLADA